MTTAFDALDSLLDAGTFEAKRTTLAAYKGEIPARVFEYVDTAYSENKKMTFPWTEEQTAELAPIFSAAASKRGLSARITEAKDDAGTRTGVTITIGERRGQKPKNSKTAETSETPASE